MSHAIENPVTVVGFPSVHVQEWHEGRFGRRPKPHAHPDWIDMIENLHHPPRRFFLTAYPSDRMTDIPDENLASDSDEYHLKFGNFENSATTSTSHSPNGGRRPTRSQLTIKDALTQNSHFQQVSKTNETEHYIMVNISIVELISN